MSPTHRALRLWCVLVATHCAGCDTSGTPPSTTSRSAVPEAPTTAATASAPAELVVLGVARSGAQLGTVHLPPGDKGKLVLKAESADAEALRALWSELVAKDEIHVKMHVPTEDGARGPLGARVFRAGTPEWPEGVKLELMSRGYDVREIAP